MVLLGRAPDTIAKSTLFYTVWRTHGAFQNHVISTLKLNFQRCCVCVKLATALNKCKGPNAQYERSLIRERRSTHLQLCKQERLNYECTVQAAERGEVTSICIDGWSVRSTTVPYTCQTIKGLDALQGLELKVTGALVHGAPGNNMALFYVSDPHISHDTNLNCEVVRLVLNAIVEKGGQVKDKLYIQADNAGDNKSRGMMAFCLWLVKQSVAKEVHLCMLICGHTHIDIDQWFSIPARQYKMIAGTTPILATPQEMVEQWVAAFKHIQPPEIQWIHAMYDYKGYFGVDGNSGAARLDKQFGGHGTARSLPPPTMGGWCN